MSHPARGAWIEIIILRACSSSGKCRTPQGVRGLKFRYPLGNFGGYESHPARGAWIEIYVNPYKLIFVFGSHPARGAWIEMPDVVCKDLGLPSHPARGAWIEMSYTPLHYKIIRQSHPARGAWIEITSVARGEYDTTGRTPQGVRGLKFCRRAADPQSAAVAPRKGCVD